MKVHFRIACYSAIGTVAIVLTACSPSATSKPDSAAGTQGSSAARNSGADTQAGEGQRGGTKESDAASSSLKQLQEGKPPTTPPSSPLQDVFFDFDRYDLSGEARTILRANAEWLKSNPASRLEIEGHCDDRGTNEYNLALGAKRAQSAREYLSTLGVAGDRLSTISYGEEIPVCREQSDSCWRQNRRARFVVLQGRSAS